MRNKFWNLGIGMGLFLQMHTALADMCSDERDQVSYGVANCEQAYNCTTNPIYGQPISKVEGDVLYYFCKYTDCNGNVEYGLAFGWLHLSCYDFKSNGPQTPPRNPSRQCGSIIHVESRTLGEGIPLVGASFSLSYFSNWSTGRVDDYKIKSVLSGGSVRPEVTGYDLKVFNENGTQVDHQTFNNNPNQSYTYTWNGLDASSNEAWGPLKYKVTIVEQATDFSPTYNKDISIGGLKAKKLGLGGWVPSNWAFYSASTETLYKADGTSRKVSATSITGGGYRIPEVDTSQVYEFDSVGRLTQIKTGLTGTIVASFLYDSNGHLSSITGPFSRTTNFNYNSSGVLTSIVAPNGKTTTVSINSSGYLASVTSPASETFSMTYSSGLLSTFTKPNSAVSTFSYDSNGFLQSDAHSGGSSKTIAASGTTYTVTSALGRVTSENFTGTGVYPDAMYQTRTLPDGSVSETRTSNGAVQESFRGSIVHSFTPQNDPRFGSQAEAPSAVEDNYFGSRSRTFTHSVNLNDPNDPFSIDTLTRVESLSGTSDPTAYTSTYTGSTKTWVDSTYLGRTHTRALDSYERVVSDQVGSQTATTFTYTNELLTQIQRGVRTTSLTYNPTTKLLSSVTNPLSQTTSFTYDSGERLASTILPDLRMIQYQYDFQGNLISITPPGKPAHIFGMNSKELVGSYEPPALDLVNNYNTGYSYNNDKQLTQIARPDGQNINFNYNSTTAQLETVTGTFGTYTHSYDSQGNLSRTTDPSGAYMDRSYSVGAISGLTYYDPSSSRIWMYNRYANGHAGLDSESFMDGAYNYNSVNYTYDTDELLTGAGSLTLSYDIPDGKLTGTALSTITDEYTYNTFGEVTGYVAKNNGTAFYSYTLTRDALGRITQKVEVLNGVTSTFNYTYDSAGRLTETKKNSVTVRTYSYDSNSNRNGGVINGTTTSATYNDQDWMTAYNVSNYAYNRNGDLTSKTNTLLSTTTSYTYDVFGNLRQVVSPTKTVDYEIDPLNRRFGKSVNSSLVERYVHDPEGKLIASLDNTNALKQRYIYASKSNVPDYFVDLAGENYRIISDHLGSVRVIIKVSTGVVMQIMEHDEFGRVLQDTNPGYTPFGFAGGIYDPDTALVRFGARDYDPETGRWTSKDPILFGAEDSNLFGYVFNDPVNWIDPLGLFDLPSDPSGLPEGWIVDPSHKDPNGERWKYRDTDRYLDFHKGRAGGKGWKGRDHWHDSQRPGKHLKPGDNVDDPCSVDGANRILNPDANSRIVPFPYFPGGGGQTQKSW